MVFGGYLCNCTQTCMKFQYVSYNSFIKYANVLMRFSATSKNIKIDSDLFLILETVTINVKIGVKF